LVAGPLIRGRLIQVDRAEHVLLVTMHHIVSDGWSVDVFVRELGALYRAYCEDAADPLPALPIQYADYAAWQRAQLGGTVLQEQLAYWQRTLAGVAPLHQVPTDRARPAQQDHAGGHVRVELGGELTAKLRTFSSRHGTTLFTTLLTAWGIVIGRLSGQDDVVIGTPVANRLRSEVEGLIGFFVNMLALRLDLSGSPTVSALLERVKLQTLAAQEHQDLPFEQVVEALQPPRSLAYTPLFQIAFAWESSERTELDLPGLRVEPVDTPRLVAVFDLALSLSEAGDRIVGTLGYATALFDRGTIERYVGYLLSLLGAMVAE